MSAQNPDDPRIKAFYTEQRQRDEAQALKSGQGNAELSHIASKEHAGSRKNLDMELGAGKSDAGKTGYIPGLTPKFGMTDVDVADSAGMANEGVGAIGRMAQSVIEHPDMIGHVIQHVAPTVAKAVKNALKGFFPEAAEDAGISTAKKTASKIGKSALRKAAPTSAKVAAKRMKADPTLKEQRAARAEKPPEKPMTTAKKVNASKATPTKRMVSKPKPQVVKKQRVLSNEIGKKAPKSVKAKSTTKDQAEMLGAKPRAGRTSRPKTKKAVTPDAEE